ncbi:hypothetical protein CLOM_g3173 [Closterium sp. NIES-68]|nr:hypothetical protein CLOM_g3173 [Closterium sp. NIES-68]GJP64656.1 hypothetical protein CLOP_g21630 [Closterium sp. NIES-67]
MALRLSDIHPPTPSSADSFSIRRRGVTHKTPPHFPSAAAAADGPSEGSHRQCHYAALGSATLAAQLGVKSHRGSRKCNVSALETPPLTSVLGKRCAAALAGTQSSATTDLELPESKRRDCDRSLRHILEESSPPAGMDMFEELGRMKSLQKTTAQSGSRPRSPPATSLTSSAALQQAASAAAASQGRLLRYKALAECPPARSAAAAAASSSMSRGMAARHAAKECPTTICGLLRNIKQKKRAAVSSPRPSYVASPPQYVASSPRIVTSFHDGRHVSATTQRHPVAMETDIAATFKTNLCPALSCASAASIRRAISPRDGISAPRHVTTSQYAFPPAQACEADARLIRTAARHQEKGNDGNIWVDEMAAFSSNPQLFSTNPNLLPRIPAASPPPYENARFSATVAMVPHEVSRSLLLPARLSAMPLSLAPFSTARISQAQPSQVQLSQNEASPTFALAPAAVSEIASAPKPSAAPAPRLVAPTAAFVAPPTAASSAAAPTAPPRKGDEDVDNIQGKYPCEKTTLKGKEPSWNDLVTLLDLNEGQLMAENEGADASQTDDDASTKEISSSHLSCYGSSQADTSVEDGDVNNEDGVNGHFSLELLGGLFAMEEGTKEKAMQDTGLDGICMEIQMEGQMEGQMEALMTHGNNGDNDNTAPPITTPNAASSVPRPHASPSAFVDNAPATCATSASIFLPTPMEPTAPNRHLVIRLPHLVLPPPGPGSSNNDWSDDCNDDTSDAADAADAGDAAAGGDASPSPHASAHSPGLPSTPPRQDTGFPSSGTDSEEQWRIAAQGETWPQGQARPQVDAPSLRQSGAALMPPAGAGGGGGGGGDCYSIPVKEEDAEAFPDASFGLKKHEDADENAKWESSTSKCTDRGMSLGMSSRNTDSYGQSPRGCGGGIPADGASKKNKRRESNRASAKRIRMRQQEHLQKLEVETRDLAAVCRSLGAQLAAASRKMEALKEQNEAMVGEKHRLLRLLRGEAAV